MLNPGEKLLDYEVVAHLGSGTFGDVYKARKPDDDSIVAIKVCASRNPEADTLRKLDHPNIVAVIDDIESHAGHVTVMKFVDAVSLATMLERIHRQSRNRLRVRDVMQRLPTPNPFHTDPKTRLPTWTQEPFASFGCRIVLEVALALQYAHELGITHRDVKPENILINQEGSGVLIDWGVAAGQTETTNETGGTLNYLTSESLERLAGLRVTPTADGHDLHAQDDIFALGVVLYEVVTGELPFPPMTADASIIAAARESLAHRPSLPANIRGCGKLPSALRVILSTCLCPTPHQRYNDITAFAEDLQCYLTFRPLKHAAETWPTCLQRLWSRHRPVWIGLAVLLGAIACAYRIDRLQTDRELSKVSEFRRQLLSDGVGDGTLPAAIQTSLFDSGFLPDSRGQRKQRAHTAHALAATYLHQNSPHAAVALLKFVVLLVPNNGEAHNDLGTAFFLAKDYDEALTAFDRALQLQCDHAAVLSNRGAVFAALGDFEAARTDLQKALQTDSRNEAAIRHLELLNETYQ